MQVVLNYLINDITNTIKYGKIKTTGGRLIKQYFIPRYSIIYIGEVIEHIIAV